MRLCVLVARITIEINLKCWKCLHKLSVLGFVSDAPVPQLTLASTVAADFNQVQEYETDSDDSDDDVDIESEELVIKYTSDTGYMYMNLSFLVYFPWSNLELYLLLVFVICFSTEAKG